MIIVDSYIYFKLESSLSNKNIVRLSNPVQEQNDEGK